MASTSLDIKVSISALSTPDPQLDDHFSNHGSGSATETSPCTFSVAGHLPQPVDMAITADDKPHNVEVNEHVPVVSTSAETSQLGHLANQEDHEAGKLASFKRYPWACFWSVYAVWVVLLVSFENQAAGNVIGGLPLLSSPHKASFDNKKAYLNFARISAIHTQLLMEP